MDAGVTSPPHNEEALNAMLRQGAPPFWEGDARMPAPKAAAVQRHRRHPAEMR